MPQDSEGPALALSWAHRLYAGFVNARARQTGHLFQGRFGSAALDEKSRARKTILAQIGENG